MQANKLVKITLIINHALEADALRILASLYSPYVLLHSARSAIIPPQKILQSRIRIKDEQQSIIECYAPYEAEFYYLQVLVDGLSLLIPGRGSIFSQAVVFYTPLYIHRDIEQSGLKRQVIEQSLSSQMQVVSLVCARDEANQFCQTLLARGYPSPIVDYGMGMGTRSRMGLLRITIPPEKEIIRTPIHYKDSRFVLNLLASQARIDLPGKGFLSHYSLRYAKINTKTHTDDPSRLASIEQIISAIDTLQGGVDWRRKNMNSSELNSLYQEKKLVQLTFTGTRGVSEIITAIAFSLGARGATMIRKSFFNFDHTEEQSESHERESCNLALSMEVASLLVMHALNELNWQEIGLTSIEDHELFHTF
jgi:hypothetical protein